jgi:hypothetical protein
MINRPASKSNFAELKRDRAGRSGRCAVDLHGHNDLAITLGNVPGIQRDVDGEDFAVGPFFDCSGAAKLPPRTFDDGIMGETGLKGISITQLTVSDGMIRWIKIPC